TKEIEPMDKEIYAAMIEATRFTREGRLNEATQLIQRALRLGGTPTGTFTGVVDEPEPIETAFRLTAEPAVAPEVSQPDDRARTKTEEKHRTAAEPDVETATRGRRPTL